MNALDLLGHSQVRGGQALPEDLVGVNRGAQMGIVGGSDDVPLIVSHGNPQELSGGALRIAVVDALLGVSQDASDLAAEGLRRRVFPRWVFHPLGEQLAESRAAADQRQPLFLAADVRIEHGLVLGGLQPQAGVNLRLEHLPAHVIHRRRQHHHQHHGHAGHQQGQLPSHGVAETKHVESSSVPNELYEWALSRRNRRHGREEMRLPSEMSRRC